MILFLNTIMTPAPLNRMNRYLLPSSDWMDVFKYTLASLAIIPWSSTYIHVKYEPPYDRRQDELEQYIHALFPAVHYHDARCEYQYQWQAALEPVMADADPAVWFCCNHDHQLIDYNLEYIDKIQHLFENPPREVMSVFYSHWAEALRWAYQQGKRQYGDFFQVELTENADSIQVVNKELLRQWWFTDSYGDTFLPRTDWHQHVKHVLFTTYVPRRELCRHFDGYSHVGADPNKCPPLSIPPGFFDNTMHLSLYQSASPISVSINPFAANYRAVDPDGADLKVTANRLPLFWYDHIQKMVGDITKVDAAEYAYKDAILAIANSVPNTNIAYEDLF